MDFIERLIGAERGSVLRFLHYTYDNTIGGKQDKGSFLEMVSFIAEYQKMPHWEKANVMYGLLGRVTEMVAELAKYNAEKAREEDAHLGTTHASPTGSSEFAHGSILARTAEVVPDREGDGRADEGEGEIRQGDLPEDDGDCTPRPFGAHPEDS